MSPFLAWGNFHARSHFARSTIPEEKWGLLVVYSAILLGTSWETQGKSVGSGERAERKFSSTSKRAPGYRLSPSNFHKFKRMPAPGWAQKMLCIIVPNIGEHFLLSSSLSSYTTPIVSIMACLAHAPKTCTQSGNFQFDIKSPSHFKYTICPKTKDALPKIQA